MNAYEITFIVRPDLEDAGIDGVIDQVLGRITSFGGEVLVTLPWNPARRRMAYPIRDFGDGVYISVTFRLDPQRTKDLENILKLNEGVLRFLMVQATDLSVEQAQQRLQQRQAAAAAPPPPPAPMPSAVQGETAVAPQPSGTTPDAVGAPTAPDLPPQEGPEAIGAGPAPELPQAVDTTLPEAPAADQIEGEADVDEVPERVPASVTVPADNVEE